MIHIRKAEEKDIQKIVQLSHKVLDHLDKKGLGYLFKGVDEAEVTCSMESPSVVIIAKEEHGRILGFLLLQKPNDDDEQTFTKSFPDAYKAGEGIIVNGIGVDPTRRKIGLATLMLKMGKKYALDKGFTKFIGIVHPDNSASLRALASIAKLERGGYFTHTTQDGRFVLQQHFVQDLT